MHYLIDGHNLIAQMPDIDLEDPNDEALLVLKLRSWVAGGRKRKVTVIFDGGLPGGRSRFHSSDQLDVRFASEGGTADALLIRRIQKARNPTEFTLVTSDLQVIEAARARRMRHVSAEAFGRRLSEHGQKAGGPAKVAPADEADEPAVSQEEIAEWLALFEAAPKAPQEAAKPRPPQKSKEGPGEGRQTRGKPPTREDVDPAILKRGDNELSGDEIDEWLKLFGQGE